MAEIKVKINKEYVCTLTQEEVNYLANNLRNYRGSEYEEPEKERVIRKPLFDIFYKNLSQLSVPIKR